MDFDLRFLGDWTLFSALPVGLILSYLAWRFYRRETRSRVDFLSWFLPFVRALIVFLLFMILTGPVLHQRKTVGDLARLLLFVDASQSMTVNDEQMSLRRKLLIALELGWLEEGVIDPALRDASARSARALAAAKRADENPTGLEAKEIAEEFATDLGGTLEALSELRGGSWSGSAEARRRMENELVGHARKLADQRIGPDVQAYLRELKKLGRTAEEWDRRVQTAFDDHVEKLAESEKAQIDKAVKRFDEMSRWERVHSHLLEGEESLFARLAEKHQVEMTKLLGSDSEVVWVPSANQNKAMEKLVDAFQPLTNKFSTDLTSGLKERTDDLGSENNVVGVLISDGRHNMGDSPVNLAKILGNRGTPVYTLGIGTPLPPEDLSILEVDAPDSVFYESRATGTIRLNDNMPSGQRFTLTIEREGRILWQKELVTERNPSRTIAYDFPIKNLVGREIENRDSDLKLSAVPLDLEVKVTELPGEKDTSNNRRPLRFAAITEKPRALILEGRPRWEFRYLRNVFERDNSWDVNALLAGGGGEEKPWRRGKEKGQFPDDLETLYSYHLIVFGDVPMTMFRPKELQWLRDYVENRGGGIVFMDGRRTPLSRYSRTPIGNLFPVEWMKTPLTGRNVQMEFTASDSISGPVSLVSGEEQNKRIWSQLPGPRFAAAAKALPGSEVLLTASSAGRSVDAMVYRRQGAGQVLYIGHDESWRWRYNVGDLYHQKFWNQVSRWIMEPSFPVEDKYVALDTGGLMYSPGDIARIRVRLRDLEGRLILDAKASADIYSKGEKVASVALTADANSGGIFRGETAPLKEGDYEVKVSVEGLPESEMKAKTYFTVQAEGGGEMADLSANEELLREVARHSGGQFFREEEISQLADKLKPLSKGRIVESDLLLWQSYWWFIPIVLLLTLEWALRKRAGML
ncbi:MAG: putative membrane protein [Candidatus Binatia bacterium]|jgi:uncharacterized membrane protein